MKLAIYDTQHIAGPVADEKDPRLCGDCVHLDGEWPRCGLTYASLRRSDSDLRYRYERAKECIAATAWHVELDARPEHGVILSAGSRTAFVSLTWLTITDRRGARKELALPGGTHEERMARRDRIVELLRLGCEPEDAWQWVVGKDGAA